MDTNKYYTPSIEEFHIGFEFEEWENPAFTNEEWIAKKIDYFTDLEYVCFPKIDKHLENYILGTSLFRVKYLDSEDIESLGFKFIKVGWSEASKIFRCNRYRGYELYLREGNTVHISTSSGLTMFEGVVKNKSMLKQVLEMIGVIEQ